MSKNKNMQTPLSIASAKGEKEIVRTLIENKTEDSVTDKKKNSALLYAINNGNPEIAKVLIKSGANLKETNSMIKGGTTLIAAAMKGNVEILKLLIENGADVNESSDKGLTPLIHGVAKDNVEIVKELIKNGSNVNQSADKGYTPLMFAAMEGNSEVVKLLLENGARVNIMAQGVTALDIAKEHDNKKIIEILNKAGSK